MKILGLSGGTLNGANDALCKEALMGAQEVGAEIEFINLNTLDLKPCTGCKACAAVCRMGVDPSESPDSGECIRCGDCIKV